MTIIKQGDWRRLRVGEALTATIICPKCGEWIVLANKFEELYKIINVGEVIPSVHHEKCGFHDMVRLEDGGH